jgi:hypothetical protein
MCTTSGCLSRGHSEFPIKNNTMTPQSFPRILGHRVRREFRKLTHAAGAWRSAMSRPPRAMETRRHQDTKKTGFLRAFASLCFIGWIPDSSAHLLKVMGPLLHSRGAEAVRRQSPIWLRTWWRESKKADAGASGTSSVSRPWGERLAFLFLRISASSFCGLIFDRSTNRKNT